MRKGRKITSGKYHKQRKKKHHEKEGQGIKPIIGEPRSKTLRVRGGNKKAILLRSDRVNVMSQNKAKEAEIKNVLETPQNRFMARQNVLFKGAIIETSIGKARITNRPTKEGHVNAILIKE